MFNIGPLELIVILVVALLVVGPKRLPEVARSIGRGLQEFRKAQTEVKETLRSSLDEPVAAAPPATGNAAAPSPGTAAAGAAAGATAQSPGSSETLDVARTLGKGLAEIRRAREELQRSFRIDLNEPPSRPKPATPAQRPEPETPEGTDTGPTAESG
jgi:TatA/E family protein of Tat protein translocase